MWFIAILNIMKLMFNKYYSYNAGNKENNNMCLYFCVCARVCVRELLGLLSSGPSFNVDIGENVSHFLCLHHFGGSDCRAICICKQERMSRMCGCVFVQML